MATSGGEVSGPTQEWFDAARDVAVFDLDVVYEMPAFCPGWLLPLNRQGARVPVTRSNLPVVHGGVLTADIVGREAELALYYARLPALPPVEMQSETARWNCFDVGVLLQAGNEVHSYADAFGGGHLATEDLLDQLADLSSAPGVAYDDLDQGWALQIHVREHDVVVFDWNPDDGDPQGSAIILRLERAEVARQAAEARRRMAVLQPLLIEAVGRDLWIARGSG